MMRYSLFLFIFLLCIVFYAGSIEVQNDNIYPFSGKIKELTVHQLNSGAWSNEGASMEWKQASYQSTSSSTDRTKPGEKIATIDLVEAVLKKGLDEIDLGYYPGTLLLHGMSEFAMLQQERYQNQQMLNEAVGLFQQFQSGEIKGHGSFESYKYGGSGAAYLVWNGIAEPLNAQLREGAHQMFTKQPQSKEGLLVPPWIKKGMEQLFIDIAFAVTPYMLYAGLHSNNQKYIDLAVKETLDLFDILYDKKTGLVHQGRGFQELGKLSEDNWSRGNGWGAFGLAILLRDLPSNHPRKEEVVKLAQKFFSTIIKYQNDEGLWHQEMTDTTSYVETSGSGLLLFGLGIALEAGIIDLKYRKNFIKGLEGYLAYIGTNGDVSHTCGSCLCPKKGTKEDYKNNPWLYNDAHAFGPAVLAFTQAAKMGIDSIAPSSKQGYYTLSDAPYLARTYVSKVKDGDVAWENDKIAFRAFGPAVRDKVGSGIDVWTKSVNYSIINKWYDENTKGKSYHIDHGEGCDFYDMGKKRGVGGLSIWIDNQPHIAETFDEIQIIRNQMDSIEFDLHYKTWNLEGISISEKRKIKMKKGDNFYQVQTTFHSPEDRELTVGIGLTNFGKGFVVQDEKLGILSVWESIDPQQGELGTGVLFDPQQFEGFRSYKGDEYVLIKVKTNTPFQYQSGAAWSKVEAFQTKALWENYIKKKIIKQTD